MIHVINALRANLIRKEIEDTMIQVVMPKLDTWDEFRFPLTPGFYRIYGLMRQLDRVRRRRWAPWKDKK